MPLPESIEKTYLPGDQVDATELNAVQHGITANHARIEQLATPELQWLVGKTIGDVTFAADGVATIDGTARVFLDCRPGLLRDVRIHCRANAAGIAFELMDGPVALESANHTGDGATWQWAVVSIAGLVVADTTRLSLSIATGQPQYIDGLALTYG